MTLFLLQRRGTSAEPDRALIVGAISEAHARVAAHKRNTDMAWTDDRYSTCREIVEDEGVLHAIYAKVRLEGEC